MEPPGTGTPPHCADGDPKHTAETSPRAERFLRFKKSHAQSHNHIPTHSSQGSILAATYVGVLLLSEANPATYDFLPQATEQTMTVPSLRLRTQLNGYPELYFFTCASPLSIVGRTCVLSSTSRPTIRRLREPCARPLPIVGRTCVLSSTSRRPYDDCVSRARGPSRSLGGPASCLPRVADHTTTTA
jgi:hypothetical protein